MTEPQTTWKPMDTAPTDGTEILGLGFPPKPQINQIHYGPDVRKIKGWKIGDAIGWSARNDFFSYSVGFEPTHWMELPDVP